MQNKSDAQLLREYAAQHSEPAFAEIVARYTDLVYSAACRQTGSPDLAREIAQSVFTDLARKARALADSSKPGASLAGWLYRGTRFATLTRLRGERRRQAHERQFMEHFNPTSETAPDWERVAPVLDEAMAELGDAEHEAVLLRYFKNQDFRAVGLALGVSDAAAQKRVSRAVERLREFFAKRGVNIGASGLVVVISANAVQAAPVGLAVTISTAAALAGSAIQTSTAIAVTKTIAMTTLQKTLLAVTIAAATVTSFLIQHQSKVSLREENRSLRQQINQLAQVTAENERLSKLLAEARIPVVPRLPAPPMSATAAPTEPPMEDWRSTNLIAQLLKGGNAPKLTAEQVDSYLKENRRNAASLLAAFRATRDAKLLQEAMEKYPSDPQVAFVAAFEKWFASGSGEDRQNFAASPEERRRWLDTFKQSAPDNALANYLSAADYFKSGQADQAVQELIAASGKQRFQDYSADFVQNDEEAWRAAGYSVAESKTVASMALVLPHLAQLKQLSQDMVSLANSYRQAGDEASAQAALQMGLNLGQRLDGSPGQALINQLVGVAIQRIALTAMNPNSPYGGTGQIVQDQLDELTRQRATIRELTSQFDSVQQRMSEQDWISYKDRWRSFGELAALQWMVSKYGQK